MAVMKQIEECMERAFNNQRPPDSKKWKGIWIDHPKHGKVMYLYHYHHLVLVYDHINHRYLYEWWELPADKRGLDSAKEYLEERWRKTQEKQV